MNRSSPTFTIKPSMMAIVSGSFTWKAAPWPSSDNISIFPRSRSTLRLTTSMPTPRPRDGGHLFGRREPGKEDVAEDLVARRPGLLGYKALPFRLGEDPLRVEAPAVVPQFDDNLPALVACLERYRPRLRFSRPPFLSAGVSRPWSKALRTMWTSGSAI